MTRRVPKPPATAVPPAEQTPSGKVGGAREGAGRPRSALPAEVIERLGPPPRPLPGKPVDARALREWNGRLLAEVQWLAIQGKILPGLAANIRANAGALDRALPADAPPVAPGDDDLDDDEDKGPELESVGADDGALRIG